MKTEPTQAAGRELARRGTGFPFFVGALLGSGAVTLLIVGIMMAVDWRRTDLVGLLPHLAAGALLGCPLIVMGLAYQRTGLRRVAAHENGLLLTRSREQLVPWSQLKCVVPVQLAMYGAKDTPRYLLDIGEKGPLEIRGDRQAQLLIDAALMAAGMQWVKLGDGTAVAVRPAQAEEAAGLAFNVLRHVRGRVR